jgi:hypothetical protein
VHPGRTDAGLDRSVRAAPPVIDHLIEKALLFFDEFCGGASRRPPRRRAVVSKHLLIAAAVPFEFNEPVDAVRVIDRASQFRADQDRVSWIGAVLAGPTRMTRSISPQW